MENKAVKDTLYYDGRCPLCSKEIAVLHKLQRGSLAFADVHHLTTLPTSQMPSREALLRRLHLRSASGHWVIGLHANVQAWSHTRWGWLYRPLLWPLIYPVALWAYERWADRRYDKRYGLGACGDHCE